MTGPSRQGGTGRLVSTPNLSGTLLQDSGPGVAVTLNGQVSKCQSYHSLRGPAPDLAASGRGLRVRPAWPEAQL